MRVDELDEASILTKEFDLIRVHILSTRDAPNNFQNFTDILAGPFFVDILEFDVDAGLCFHVGQPSRNR
jgi:hypothetical protein